MGNIWLRSQAQKCWKQHWDDVTELATDVLIEQMNVMNEDEEDDVLLQPLTVTRWSRYRTLDTRDGHLPDLWTTC